MHAMGDHQERGRRLERLLTEFFRLFDVEPRLSYSIDLEQIDGSLNFDTSPYIVKKARWRSESR